MQDQDERGDGKSGADDDPIGIPEPGGTIHREIPPIPEALLDPRPVILVGTIVWTLALLGVMFIADVDSRAMALCSVGVGVGAAGWLVYTLQRRAVLRGSAGAQVGIAMHKEKPAGNELAP